MPIGSNRKLLVSSHRVGCPLLGDRDVEHCLSCPNLVSLDLGDPDAWISCRIPGDSLPHDLLSLGVMD